jgi:hypothetical protein
MSKFWDAIFKVFMAEVEVNVTAVMTEEVFFDVTVTESLLPRY